MVQDTNKIVLTNKNICSILVIARRNETQKDPSSNGAPTPSDRSST